MQRAELEGHHTRDRLEGVKPLLVACRTVGLVQNVSNVPITTRHLNSAIREGLAKSGAGLQALAFAFTKISLSTDCHSLDGGRRLHGQAVANRVDRHLLHGGLAGADGRH